MAWSDNAQVDDNSKRSEESDHVVRGFFNRKKRFMARHELPDYGVDLVIELMDERDQVQGFQFAIQIKSSLTSPLIHNNTFISFPFKTSRLGYLCRRTPGMGVIIFYDESRQTAFFEYVEVIVEKLSDDRPNEEWKLQDDVNIHIPFSNILDENQVQIIYRKMSLRSQSMNAMWLGEGKKYNLPIITSMNDTNYYSDEKFLEDFENFGGGMMINEQKFVEIHLVLSSLNKQRILKSPKFLFLAAVTYCELGDVVEANYYLKRCKQKWADLTDFEKELLQMLAPKVTFLAGDIEIDELVRQLNYILPLIADPLNKTNLRISLLTLEINSTLQNSRDFLTKFESYLTEIGHLQLSETSKFHLKLQLCEAIGNKVIQLFSIVHKEIRIKKSLKVNPLSERIVSELDLIYKFTNIHDNIIEQVLNYAIEKKDQNLTALSILRRGNFFMQLQFNVVIYQIPHNLTDVVKFYKINYFDLTNAFKIFEEKGGFREAQLSIGNAIEIQDIFEFSFPNNTSINFLPQSDLIVKIKEIEAKSGIMPYVFHIKNIIEETREALNKKKYFNENSELNDEQLLKFGQEILNGYEIPNERLPNIISEIKAFQKFHQFNKNVDLELQVNQEHLQYKSITYLYPSKYIIVSKKTGLQVGPNTDIDALLKEAEKLMK